MTAPLPKPERRSFTVAEFAERHGVSEHTVKRWINGGRVRALKIGRLVRITVEAEQAMIDAHAKEVTP